VSFVLPDNLSRFRVMVVAQAGRPLRFRRSPLHGQEAPAPAPSLPGWRGRGLLPGRSRDPQLRGGRGHRDLEMSFSGDAVSAEGGTRREIVGGGGPGRGGPCGTAGRWRRQGRVPLQEPGRRGDRRLEWTVPVRAPERLETAATSAWWRPNPRSRSCPARQGSQPGVGAVLALSPTALAGLQEGARFLLEYPYGCLEQRLSRMLPVISGAELTAAFGLGTVGDLKTGFQSELDRLSDFQAPSGGFAYWTGPSRADPYITPTPSRSPPWRGRKATACPGRSWPRPRLAQDDPERQAGLGLPLQRERRSTRPAPTRSTPWPAREPMRATSSSSTSAGPDPAAGPGLPAQGRRLWYPRIRPRAGPSPRTCSTISRQAPRSLHFEEPEGRSCPGCTAPASRPRP